MALVLTAETNPGTATWEEQGLVPGGITEVFMGDQAHALVFNPSGDPLPTTQTALVGSTVWVDAQSSGNSENLTLTAEDESEGLTLQFKNVGEDAVVLLDDGGAVLGIIMANGTAVASCDGTEWLVSTAIPQVFALITVPNVGGGGTDAALTLQLYEPNGTTAVAGIYFAMIVTKSVAFSPVVDVDTTVTFSAATTGTIVNTGAGWALIGTDVNGAFACTATNSADETVVFEVHQPAAMGISNLRAALIIGSNSDPATWS